MISQHFSLKTAALCLNCNEIGENLVQCCCCGSATSLLSLQGVLNGTAQSQARPNDKFMAEVEEMEMELR